jgi:hypothetical protein
VRPRGILDPFEQTWLERHLFTIFGAVIVAGIVAIVAGCWWVATDYSERHQRFMADCQKERKEYECTAMWRAGEPTTVVVPVRQ